MCRILGIISSNGFSLYYLSGFRKLAEHGRVRNGAKPGHKDGWGIVTYDGGNPRYLAREPRSASDDPKYLKVSGFLSKYPRGGIVIAHLRKISKSGGPASVENTHPFIEGRWAFAHNGGITKFNIRPNGLQGVTDSERFFRLLINRVEKVGNFGKALKWSVSFVRRKFDYSSLNFVLSDGNALYGYRDCIDDENYYTLLYKRNSANVVFSQEPLDKGDWTSISNGWLAIVRKDLSLELRQIAQ